MRLLVAGGAGFIGSAYVHGRGSTRTRATPSACSTSSPTRAGRENLEGLDPDRVELVEGDIADPDAVARRDRGLRRDRQLRRRVARRPLDRVAGRVHPDRRVRHLRAARGGAATPGIRHLQVSTDEVYGSIEAGSFTEDSPLDPSSPYSASKAGGDLIVGAYRHTYGADALIVRGSNNYGPRQHPEKLIPLCILNALAGDPLPVYGDGMQVRNWLFVEDFCAGDRPGAGARRGRARPTTSAAPTSCRTSTS